MFWVTIYQISLVLIVEEQFDVEKKHAWKKVTDYSLLGFKAYELQIVRDVFCANHEILLLYEMWVEFAAYML